MSLKILATGDIHIGRCPSHLPDLETAQQYSCGSMWERIVDVAISHGVSLVALSGDVVDHENRFFESLGPLERGLKLLADHNIHTFAVSGNHDFDVLPRLERSVGGDHFHLLGKEGRWEKFQFPITGTPQMAILGWSFPSRHYSLSPLDHASLDLLHQESESLPTMGLLHADLDVSDSSYAPVSRRELLECDLNFWLLGHNHKPKLISSPTGSDILYPGSPQGMDPGETGPHGPWLIELEGTQDPIFKQLPLSPVRYENISLDLTGIATRENFEARLLDETRKQFDDFVDQQDSLRYLLLRISLTGQTSLCSELDAYVLGICEETERTLSDATMRIDRITNQTHPLVDLQQLAENSDPPGILARTIIRLQNNQIDADMQRLLQQASEQMQSVHRAPTYSRIVDDAAPQAETARDYLIRQGTLLLDTLRVQEQSA